MEVVLVKREVEVPKEVNELGAFIVGLVEDIKAKKDVTTMIAENMPALMVGIEGFDKMTEEAKHKAFYAFCGLLVADLAAVLLAPAPVAPEPAA